MSHPGTPHNKAPAAPTRLCWAARAYRGGATLALALLVAQAGHSVLSGLWAQEFPRWPSWSTALAGLLALWGNASALTDTRHHHGHAGWGEWVETRVQARAAIWALTLIPLAPLVPSGRVALVLSGAFGMAALLARYGPSFGPGGMVGWQRSPWGRMWRWLCPPLSVDGCLAWRRVAHALVREVPDLDGQMIVVHHPPRVVHTPASIHDDMALTIGRADPMVLLRPEGRRMGSAPAGQPGHQMIYKMHYGGVSAHGNRYETATHPVWLDGWLACMHGRDPIPGEAWPIARPHTAHGLLEEAFLRAEGASTHAQEKATQTPATASGGCRPRPHPDNQHLDTLHTIAHIVARSTGTAVGWLMRTGLFGHRKGKGPQTGARERPAAAAAPCTCAHARALHRGC